ncbi:hypothetical protein CEUSTIGMA_g11290.t1 [Chlamydomonas eustigma]|uniref:Uncharacterized protein n=1 Tax=Chlamydomonas eustigma TaxID=1157962 RepID=A0A250XL86_9CHLO|nr:hypothetical protein CEUSTIGMA_g11290.t1 [Chlamydomonas eustigma]|eukprot:GAX83865.1 hypothetical protein CEUSTIGMA_g11290.t1 [Chlamydomonas eustigma]
MFAFKKFNFFQQHGIDLHECPNTSTCFAASKSYLFVGCDNGIFHALDERAKDVFNFVAHGHRVHDAVWLEHGNLLVTVGSEEPGYLSSTIKLWDCNKLETLSTSSASTSATSTRTDQASSTSIHIQSPAVALLRSCRLFGPRYPEAEVTCLSATSSHRLGTTVSVAVGLASGMVYIFSGDLSAKGKLQHLSKVSARPDSGDRWSVTGVAWHGPSPASCVALKPSGAGQASSDGMLSIGNEEDGQLPLLQSLYVVTESQTLSFNVQTGLKTILDQQGCSKTKCSLLRSGLLVVARPEGLYDYTVDTRAGCTVFEGAKQQVALLRRFLVVVTSESGELGAPFSTIHVLDLRNRMAAASITLQHVLAVVPAWDALMVVTGSGKAYLLKEVELAAQLDVLFKRSLHKLALDIARAEGADSATIANIQQRWGDHLYNKGEYDAAMSQYLETLACLEPSYVIRRFLDAQRIHNLTCYLEMLHNKGLASADHTTLLLNCYTKLKDVDKLDAFIYGSSTSNESILGDEGLVASGAARTGDAIESALDGNVIPSTEELKSKRAEVIDAFIKGVELPQKDKDVKARKSNKHSRSSEGMPAGILSTVLAPERESPSSARGPETSSSGRQSDHSRGKPWLSSGPAERQASFMFDAETATKVLRAAGYYSHALWVASASKQSDWVLEILLDDCANYDDAISFLDTLPRKERASALRRYGKALISHQAESATRLIMELCIPLPPSTSVGGNIDNSSAFVSSVADFAHLYNDRPTALMLLCEFIMNTSSSGGNTTSATLNVDEAERHERLLYHTLLELYLAETLSDELTGRKAEEAASGLEELPAKHVQKEHHRDDAGGAPSSSGTTPMSVSAVKAASPSELARRAKALELLQKGWPPHLQREPKYDADHALVLCRLHVFREGLVFLYDKLRLYREVLQVHMETGDHAALIAATVRYGDASRGGDPQLWAEILDYFVRQPGEACLQSALLVVEHIEAGNILPPLVVLQALAQNSAITMGHVRGYVARQVSRETQDLAKGREQVAKLAAETAALQVEAHRLRTQPKVFQNSKCSASGQPLELPVVHFYCGHSYNQRSLGDSDAECPICAPDFRRVLEIRRNMVASASQQDRFFSELKEAPDGFSVVTEHFGRGLMNLTAAATSTGV